VPRAKKTTHTITLEQRRTSMEDLAGCHAFLSLQIHHWLLNHSYNFESSPLKWWAPCLASGFCQFERSLRQ
jgi:hypothetical protein